MRSLALRTILMAGVIFTGASVVYSQAVQTQTGQSLDANFQLGSGGYNRVVGGVGGVNSQLYVTGQVRGLAGFGGSVGYSAADQLRLSLPSSGFSTFNRQSVGLADVYRGDLYTPTPYFDRSSTVFGVRAISRGFTAPGSNVPARRSSVTRKLYSSVTSDYREVTWAGQRLDRGATASRVLSPEYLAGANTDSFQSRGALRSGDSLFGVGRFSDQQRLARELQELEKKDIPEEAVDAELRGEIDAKRKLREVPERETPELADKKTDSGTIDGQITPPDQDVYTDLLIRLEEQARHRKEKLDKLKLNELELLDEESDAEYAEDGGIDSGLGEIIKFDRTKGLFIGRLAGKSKDIINKRLAACEKLLKEGKYYKAVDEYQMLVVVDGHNPLVYVGLAQSQLAAGEMLNAAINFRSAMRILPPIMETRINLVGMLGEKVVKERLASVMKRIKDNDDPSVMLAFLATYLNANTGNKDQAQKMATVLKGVAGDDKLLDAYATFVLTGKRPGEVNSSKKPATDETEKE